MKTAAALILAFTAVRGFRFEVTNDYIAQVNTLSFNWLLLFFFFVWVIIQSLRERDKRLKICAAAFAVTVSVFYIAGVSLSKMYRLSWIWESRRYLVNTMNLFYSHSVLYYAFAFLIFRLLRDAPAGLTESGEYRFSLRRVAAGWGFLLVLYIPWYLHCYPGLLSPDSGGQIRDAVVTLNALDDHHSAFLDLILRCILLPIQNLTNSLQTGVGIVTALQMLILTLVFAVCGEWMRPYLRSRLLRAAVWLWFGLYPVNPLFSITLWKDILFSACFLVLVLCLDGVVRNEAGFFSDRRKQAVLFGSLLLLPLMRHNGWSVTLAVAAAILFFFPDSRRQTAAGLAAIAVLFGLWRLVCFPLLNVTGTLPQHVWSVQEQQIVRVLDERRDEMLEEEQAAAESYFDIPEIWTVYNPRLSDPVKAHFNVDRYREDPGAFFRLWIRLGTRYPLQYLEALLLNNYGYWFPEVHPWISEFWMPESARIGNIHPAPILSIAPVQRMADFVVSYQYTKTPLVFLMFSPGACFWMWLFCGFYCLYRNMKKFIIFLPGAALWLGILVTPISNDFRYVYGLFITLPLLLASVLQPGTDAVQDCTGGMREEEK